MACTLGETDAVLGGFAAGVTARRCTIARRAANRAASAAAAAALD